MRVVTLREYATLPRPQVQWIVEGLLPKPGMVMLMGPPKAGKSFLALDVAVRIARGQPVLGHPSHASRVLYLQLDTSEQIWRDRILALDKTGYDIDPPNLVMVHPEDEIRPVNIMTIAGQSWLQTALTTARPDLVVIDVLREIHTGDENDSTEMKRVFDELMKRLAGRSVLFVHHTRKIPDDASRIDPVAVARGSSYITGKMDAYWLLYDGRLYLTSRFEDNRVLTTRRAPSGMFEFPTTASIPVETSPPEHLETSATPPLESTPSPPPS